jgi:hypothetical protein
MLKAPYITDLQNEYHIASLSADRLRVRAYSEDFQSVWREHPGTRSLPVLNGVRNKQLPDHIAFVSFLWFTLVATHKRR